MVPRWREMLNDEHIFKQVFIYSFRFSTGPMSKVLDLELSADMLSMLLAKKFKNIDVFCEFLEVVGFLCE
jgi:Cullin binding